MTSLSRRERTLMVGMGAVVAGGRPLSLVVEPILARSGRRDHRARAGGGPRAAATPDRAGPPDRRGAPPSTRASRSEPRRLLRGPTAPLAASELQKLVKDCWPRSNIEVRSERVLPASDQNGLQEVPIELTIMGSIRDTMTALYRLEHADRLFTIKDLKIRVVAVGQPPSC